MSTSYISRKLKTHSAKNFRDLFIQSLSDNKITGYVFMGRTTAYANESNPEIITNTIQNEKRSWDTMLAAKKVAPGDVEFVIPIQRWTANTRYKQYDDTVPLNDLISETQDGAVTVYPMYVLNSENNVYKCICNNLSSASQVEPLGNYSENDGYIQTESGGNVEYIWKYLYNVRESNKFFTDEWLPIPFPYANTNSNDYDISEETLVDGALAKIKMTNSGSGYAHTKVNVASFTSNQTLLQITDDIALANSNVKVNMQVSGTGILTGTYITDVFDSNNRIRLSTGAISSGGGSSNTIDILTRVFIDGDGSDTVTEVRLSNTGGIQKVDVTSIGSGYTRANVIIYGSGTGATARAILPPKFGHGYNPAMELGANNIMIVSRIGEVDATEGGLIPTDTSFRQYGLVLGAYKYSGTDPITGLSANTVVSQTTDLTLLSGASYTLNELVYQGSSAANATFSGYVVSQTTSVIKLTEIKGTPEIGKIVMGSSSSVSRPLAQIKNPDLKLYSGDIVYAENITKVDRSQGQAEEVKLVFKF